MIFVAAPQRGSEVGLLRGRRGLVGLRHLGCGVVGELRQVGDIELGALLGAEATLCTDFEVGSDGRLTGRLLGANCRGPEKLRRLHDWFGGAPATLWAYGDSAGDRELLAAAHHPHLVKDVVIEAVPA